MKTLRFKESDVARYKDSIKSIDNRIEDLKVKRKKVEIRLKKKLNEG